MSKRKSTPSVPDDGDEGAGFSSQVRVKNGTTSHRSNGDRAGIPRNPSSKSVSYYESSFSDYKSGCIFSMELTNFMTYSSQRITFGPMLNLIIGPNGSGKSAINCGLILGLAGDAKDTGRQNSLASYIKHGETQATIKIKIIRKDSESRNDKTTYISLVRTLTRKSTTDDRAETTWIIGRGQSMTTEQVRRDVIPHLNVKPDNLCQFLPQERIAEFVKLKNDQLLQSTLKAIDDKENLEAYSKLKELSVQLKRNLEITTTGTQKLEQDQRLHERERGDLERLERMKKLKDEVKCINAKLPYMELRRAQQNADEAVTAVRTLEQELKDKQSTTAPLRRRVLEAKAKFEQARQDDLKHVKSIREKMELLKRHRSNLLNLEKEIPHSRYQFGSQQEAKKSKQAAIRRLEQKMSEDSVELQRLVEMSSQDQNDLQPQITSLERELTRQRQLETQVRHKVEDLESDLTGLRENVNSKLMEKKRLENVQIAQKRILQAKAAGAATAWEWLDRNGELFTGNIYRPLIFNIKPTDMKYAKFIEHAISFNDQIAFVCTNPDDLQLFTASLARDCKGLTVNVILANQNERENENALRPRHDIKDLKRYGLQEYMVNMFDCPLPIKRYLCQAYNLHNTPVGTSKAADHVDELMRLGIRRFYSLDTMYSTVISKYDRTTSTTCAQLRPPTFLVNRSEDEALHRLAKEIQAGKQEHAAKAEQFNQEKDKLSKIRERMTQIKKEITALKSVTDSIDLAKRSIEANKNKIQELQQSMPNLAVIRQKLVAKIEDVNRRRTELMETIFRVSDDLNSLLTERVRTTLRVKTHSHVHRKLEAELKEKESEFVALTRRIQEQKQELQRIKIDLDKRKKDFLDRHGYSFDKLPPARKAAFDKLPDSLEELKAQLHMKRMQIDERGIREIDITEFELREKRIEQLKKDLASTQADQEKIRTSIARNKVKWLESTNRYIEKISMDFGQFMERMKYAGEVSLKVPENPDEFENYGIQVMVRYRSREKLKELGDVHQSGGERSVATMLYMIALQNITNLPFRVVDEINQGMDEHNEKAVFDFIVETATKNSSQYLLISPKLLPGLKYSDRMWVHVLHNTPVMKWTEFEKPRVT